MGGDGGLGKVLVNFIYLFIYFLTKYPILIFLLGGGDGGRGGGRVKWIELFLGGGGRGGGGCNFINKESTSV